MNDPAALFGFDPPQVDPVDVLAIAGRHWGVIGTAHRLRGERSQNTLIDDGEGSAWILQLQSASEDPAAIDLQTRAMVHLEHRAPDLPVSRVVRTLDGDLHATIEVDGRVHLARLVTYLPGVTFEPVETMPDNAYERIGALLGQIAEALDGFEHPAAGHFMPWDLGNGLIVDDDLRAGLSEPSLAALASVDERLRAVADALPGLPRRIIHNDGHAGNLVRPDAGSHLVSGVIDFGDLVDTVTVADVAIIAESFAPDHHDPSRVVAAITAGYHRYVPLGDDEIAAIPELVLARAALNVLLGEFQIRSAPHLADRAAAMLGEVTARMAHWSRLDTGEMIDRIHRTIVSGAPSERTAP